MSVRDYYYAHFAELTPDKQFHFATRIKNYFKSHDFDQYFATYTPSQDLAAILRNNDFSHVNQAAARRPYFEKYDHLFAIEAALFRVNHLLNEYNIDLRSELLRHIPLERLYSLSDALLADDGALLTLSTWAVNIIALTEILFPRGQNVIRTLANRILALDTTKTLDTAGTLAPAETINTTEPPDPLLLLYLYTHIILCDSNFYTRPVSETALAQVMLDRCAALIEQHFDKLILDVRIEFLVCANLVNAAINAGTTSSAALNANTPSTAATSTTARADTTTYPELRARIAAECRQRLAEHPYLTDPRRPASHHTLSGAEHTNVLFIMSGLD